jgi:glyoxylase-like metal-dependent hydrolase (beta-lactamase superfamily II)
MSTIDIDTLQGWLETNKPVIILDIRSNADRATWAIPGSLHVDAYAELKAHNVHALDGVSLPANVPVVTVCNVGHVSQVAAEQLLARGMQACSLKGGMRAWSLSWNVANVPLPGDGVQVVQIRRVGKGCLSYLIASQEEALVIDASLEPDVYLNLARSRGWRITAVLDTHIHADHLSRSRSLSERCGATVYLPEQKRVVYPFKALKNGSTIKTGTAPITALHTPGHTPESMCYLLNQRALFSGDSLFLQGVGRPDLLGSAEKSRANAHLLYQSLQRLLTLPSETILLPGHSNTPAPFDKVPLTASLGDLRNQVELLRISESEFVETLLARIPPAPPNHDRIVELNETGLLIENPVELEAGANHCAIS